MLLFEHECWTTERKCAGKVRILDNDPGVGAEFASETINAVHQTADQIVPFWPCEGCVPFRKCHSSRMSNYQALSIVAHESEQTLLLLFAHRPVAAGQWEYRIVKVPRLHVYVSV